MKLNQITLLIILYLILLFYNYLAYKIGELSGKRELYKEIIRGKTK